MSLHRTILGIPPLRYPRNRIFLSKSTVGRARLSPFSPFTVNGPVKFAIEGRKLFVLDDDGKEHEMEIIERILRLPAEQAKPQH